MPQTIILATHLARMRPVSERRRYCRYAEESLMNRAVDAQSLATLPQPPQNEVAPHRAKVTTGAASAATGSFIKFVREYS